MATDFWGSDEIESDGNYDVGGGDFPVIPDGTRVKALIEKVELFDEDNKKFNYKTGLDEECISVRFDIEEGEFKGQKIFKNYFIESNDETEKTKARNMFFAMDHNAGGKIMALKRKPSEDELNRYLINKSMVIVVGMMQDKKTKEKRNYLQGLSASKNKPSHQAAPLQSEKPVQRQQARPMSNDMDDDIPFN